MKVSIKLKHTQLVSLVAFMSVMLKDNNYSSRTDAIVALLMAKLYKKLKEKTILMEPRKYSFQVSPETALAFIEFFTAIPVDRCTHASNIVDSLIRQFDQQTASIY